MTKAQFKEAMKRGLGRCVIELNKQDNIEKYRDLVLWGCLHNLAYDTQCEGTRAEYMYVLQSNFEGDCFETKIIEKYKNPTMDSWLFDHYSEMLYLFAVDGSENAKQALYEKFDELLECNSHRQRKIYLQQREQFEWLCIWITTLDGFTAFKNIIERVGEAYVKCNCQKQFSLDWFYANSLSKLGKKRIENYLTKQSLSSPYASAFKRETEKYNANTTVDNPSELLYTVDKVVEECKIKNISRYRVVSRMFAKSASAEELETLAKLVLLEQDATIKAQLLFVFTRKKFPLDINLMVDYSRSDNKNMKTASFQVLENHPSEIVRDYAISLLLENKDLVEGIGLLCKNFQKADTELLIGKLKSIPVKYREGAWHSAYMDVLELCESNKIDCTELLPFMYENSLCSYCRESVVRALKKNKLLSKDIQEECEYDSRADIRSYIKRYAK